MESNLNVGLLSLDKRKLLSPHDEPGLFTAKLEQPEVMSVEMQAKKLLSDNHIVASSVRGLDKYPTEDGSTERGYLLRESVIVDLAEHDLAHDYRITKFTVEDIRDYLDGDQTPPVHSHFLRQIMKYMIDR